MKPGLIQINHSAVIGILNLLIKLGSLLHGKHSNFPSAPDPPVGLN